MKCISNVKQTTELNMVEVRWDSGEKSGEGAAFILAG